MEDEVVSEGRFVTNFQKCKQGLVEQAIKEYESRTGDKGLYIKEEAYWCNGHLDGSLSSLHSTHDRDLSVFWDIYWNLCLGAK